METLELTKKDFNGANEYIGKDDLSNYSGHLKIASGLGWVKFKALSVSGWIIAEAGTGIEAGDGIEAGLCMWRAPKEDELKITCGKLEAGEVCFGNLVEVGMPDQKEEKSELCAGKVVEIDGVKYKLTLA